MSPWSLIFVSPIQGETKPFQPKGTKGGQNSIPLLLINTCLLLRLGLSCL